METETEQEPSTRDGFRETTPTQQRVRRMITNQQIRQNTKYEDQKRQRRKNVLLRSPTKNYHIQHVWQNSKKGRRKQHAGGHGPNALKMMVPTLRQLPNSTHGRLLRPPALRFFAGSAAGTAGTFFRLFFLPSEKRMNELPRRRQAGRQAAQTVVWVFRSLRQKVM